MEDGKAGATWSRGQALTFQSKSLSWKISGTSFVIISVLNLSLWAFHTNVIFHRWLKLSQNERQKKKE